MDKDEIKSRINKKIDEDDYYASQVEQALNTNNNYWLAHLLQLVGVFIKIGSEIWNWLSSLFR